MCTGYEKLKMYGFLVHGCIDGGSNFCVYATLALNKRGSTLRDVFDKAVDEYGYPLRMRADMCFEATFVGQRMLDERGEGSFITGPSTANQVSGSWSLCQQPFAYLLVVTIIYNHPCLHSLLGPRCTCTCACSA